MIIFQILQVKVKEMRRMTAIAKASNKGKASNKTSDPQCVNLLDGSSRCRIQTVRLFMRMTIMHTRVRKYVG